MTRISTDQAIKVIEFARVQAMDALEAENRRLHEQGLSHEAVHDIRVLTKQLRAWARLLKPFDSDFYVRSETNLKAIGKQLSQHRDQKVQHDALNALQPHLPDELQTVIPDLLESLTPPSDEVAANDPLCHSLENALDLEWAHWQQFRPQSTQDPRRLSKRLQKTQKRVLELGQSRRHKNATELHHQWRKWVKRLMFQLRLFQDAGALEADEALHRLKILGSQLGKEHDFVMLEHAVEHSRPPFQALDHGQQRQLQQALKRQRHHHLKKAKKHYKRIKSRLKPA
jgi:CHAD domain-containing protein